MPTRALSIPLILTLPLNNLTHRFARGASKSDGKDNRPNGGHGDQGAPAHVVSGVPIAVDARENEQDYQAAECVSFEPFHGGNTFCCALVALSCGLVHEGHDLGF